MAEKAKNDAVAPGSWFSRWGASLSRARQLEGLSALNDAELTKRGLRRQDIVRYVYRDIYHI